MKYKTSTDTVILNHVKEAIEMATWPDGKDQPSALDGEDGCCEIIVAPMTTAYWLKPGGLE